MEYRKGINSFFQTKRTLLIFGIATFTAMVGFGFQFFSNHYFLGPHINELNYLEQLATSVLATCGENTYRPSCYDEEIPRLLSREGISMEEAFQVTRIVQEQDKEYWYCHVLGHELSAIETEKDPNGWKDVVARCPSGMCSSGCLHGAFQERFRTESLPDVSIKELTDELSGICEPRSDWSPTGLEQGTCYHALGHLTMYITDANIDKSTELCDEIALKDDGRDYSQLCYDGAYMQIFQPLDPEDFALIEGKQPIKEELHSFCRQFDSLKRSACWTEGWPLFFEELKTPEGLIEFCDELSYDETQRGRCYNAIFYVLTAQFNFDDDRISNLCGALPNDVRGRCFANAASRMIETDWRLIDRSVVLCENAAKYDMRTGDQCYEELLFYSTYNFRPDSQEFKNLCSSLPELWSTQCFNRASSF